MILKNSLYISHDMISKVVKEGDIVVDATAGNGNDTLYMAKTVGETGHVFAFDIQHTALSVTKSLLESNNMENRVTLINDGHENMDRYINTEITAIMFNLGYLPKGDHNICTRANTTIEAIKKGLSLIKVGGIISIVVYYGGDSGFFEKEEVMKYIKTIDYKQYAVLVHDFINQPNCPPIAICIQRLY